MGLNSVSINRPYVNPDGKKPVNRKEQDEKSSGLKRELEQNQNSKSHGLELVDEFQASKNTSAQSDKPSWESVRNQIKSQPKFTPHNINSYAGITPVQNETAPHKATSTTINIAQILKDFRNTALAIGTPAELQEEVDAYLSLINSQVQKENPNVKLIKSNLKNASTILDNYITETLQKESKVVENWVDAIFLQQIDFKYDENDINPQFLVKFPERNQNKETLITEEKSVETQPVTPKKVQMDEELKSLFIKSKHLAKADNPKAALLSFQKALARAEELGENSVKSKIYLEVGDIYNDYDYLAQALTSYNKSVENATENSVKVKAHYNMAQIYDEVNQISPALDHYYSSIAFAGEENNLNVQTVSLTKMGNIYADMYEQEALDYYDNARDLAIETENPQMKGFVASNAANSLKKFGEPKAALHEFSQAVQYYTQAESPLKIAQNYNSAADLMIEYHNLNKAKSLLQKGLINAQKANNAELITEITEKLEIFS